MRSEKKERHSIERLLPYRIVLPERTILDVLETFQLCNNFSSIGGSFLVAVEAVDCKIGEEPEPYS